MPRKRDPQLHEKKIERLKDEVSGISDKDAGWWKQTFNICKSVNKACDDFFRRRGVPLPEFNAYENDNQ
jgi:hypothetical protein